MVYYGIREEGEEVGGEGGEEDKEEVDEMRERRVFSEEEGGYGGGYNGYEIHLVAMAAAHPNRTIPMGQTNNFFLFFLALGGWA
jgi:hypothetical protein